MGYPRNRSITICADDFGISTVANANILALAQLGKIHRVAVMPCGIMSTEEIAALKQTGVALDIHLDIFHSKHSPYHETPHTAARVARFLREYLTGRLRTKRILVAWEKQLDTFHDLFGKYPDGINSHEHVHFFPPYFTIASALAKKHGIPRIRFGVVDTRIYKNMVAHIIKHLRKTDMRRYRKMGFASSDHLVSLDWISDTDSFLAHLPTGETELVVHPHRSEEFELIKKHF